MFVINVVARREHASFHMHWLLQSATNKKKCLIKARDISRSSFHRALLDLSCSVNVIALGKKRR